jgi:hypothetical protein
MKPKLARHVTSRSELIHRIRHELEERGWPRIQMMLLVTLTGGAGFLASFAMLTFGVDSLAVRYALAVGIAYLVFLVLLWLWLRTSLDDYDDLDDAVEGILNLVPDATPSGARMVGGGGRFGGGGSSGQWQTDARSEPLVELPDVPFSGVEVADADEAIPLVVILFIAGLVLTVVLASASIVFSAPILFAEMIVDGILAATLYRRLRRIESRHWLRAAIRRTIVPFAITAVIAALVGWGLSVYVPEARSIGEVISLR